MRVSMLSSAVALALASPAIAQDAADPDGVTEVIVVEEVVSPAPAVATPPAPPAMRFVPSEQVQPTPPSTLSANGEVPPCKGKLVDGCINPREAGLNYGNRPLDYWPGKPASEFDTPLPVKKPGS